jgi:hypothetical protein
MRIRAFLAGLAAVMAVLLVAAPAFSGPGTAQINVTETNKTCHLALLSVSKVHTLILFHLINNGTVPHGIMIGTVKSGMALPKGSGNLYFNFKHPGHFHYACTAGAYAHPSIIARGIFTIRST